MEVAALQLLVLTAMPLAGVRGWNFGSVWSNKSIAYLPYNVHFPPPCPRPRGIRFVLRHADSLTSTSFMKDGLFKGEAPANDTTWKEFPATFSSRATAPSSSATATSSRATGLSSRGTAPSSTATAPSSFTTAASSRTTALSSLATATSSRATALSSLATGLSSNATATSSGTTAANSTATAPISPPPTLPSKAAKI